MIIIGIETSCDETAVAVARGEGDGVEILSNVVSSQIDIHKIYGGVIPEVAAREHVLTILPTVEEAFRLAGITHSGLPATPLARGEISPNKGSAPGGGRGVDAIAVTNGPGLITSLLSGLETAKVLSYAWSVPLVGVNHIAGHIYANFIEEEVCGNSKFKIQNSNIKSKIENRKSKINFPALVLTVSGGHTMLVLMKGHGQFKTIGDTRDDAAGEAFDKGAKLLGLGYPGGPAISAEADKFSIADFRLPIENINKSQIANRKSQINLPRPMIDSGDFDFSFSGLKTALLYLLQKDKNWNERIPEYAFEYQKAIAETLVSKTIKAAQKYKVKTVMLAGGVSANKSLRSELEKAVNEKLSGVGFHMPELQYTTDNAAMVAAAGYFQAKTGSFVDWSKIKVDPNLALR